MNHLNQAQVASLIRKELKNIGVKARVKSEHGDCVVVKLDYWWDERFFKDISGILYKFDEDPQDVSNTDLFECQNIIKGTPQVRYLFISNGEPTESDRQLVRDFLRERMGVVDYETCRARLNGDYNWAIRHYIKNPMFFDYLKSIGKENELSIKTLNKGD